MKFKLIFILFNIVILFSFLVIFFMPLAVLGWDYTREFWIGNWYLPVVFLIVVGGLNGYFILNWRLFTLLEKEAWGGIIGYVLDRLKNGRVRRQEVRIGINAALVSARLEVIGEIEQLVRSKRPSIMDEFALPLGIPYLLNSDPASAENYFQDFLEQKGKNRPWIIWCYGFALLLQRKIDEAKVQFLALKEEKDPVILLLTSYMLDTCAMGDEEAEGYKKAMTADLRARFTEEEFKKEIDKARSSVHIVVLGKVLDEAVEWLYAPEKTERNGE